LHNANSRADTLVTNSGKIHAKSGQVFLSAPTASNILRDTVNVPGSFRANSVGMHNSRIVINGAAGGRVSVTGRLAANGGRKHKGGSIAISGASVNLAGKVSANAKTGGSVTVAGGTVLTVSGTVAAKGPPGQGGTIDLTGANVTVIGALIDASGATGGTVLIGGDYRGGGTLAHAQATSIDSASVIRADAWADNSGAIIVWSDGLTRANGTLTARGSGNGDGGLIKTSGHSVDFSGIRIDASARAGKAGLWLVDPTDLTIDAAAAATIGGILDGGTDVTLQTNAHGSTGGPGNTSAGPGDIIIRSGVTWSSASRLTLTAYAATAFNAPITTTVAGKSLLKLSFAQGASVSYAETSHGSGVGIAGQALTIKGESYNLFYSLSAFSGVNSSETGRITQAAGNAAAQVVNPATLVFTAKGAARDYGDANPALSGSISGFKNGQTAANFGGDIWTTLAGETSNVGSYAITGGLTTAAPNYVISQAAGNATALVINPATLVFTANGATRGYGDANPALGGWTSGLRTAGRRPTSAATSGPRWRARLRMSAATRSPAV
jgi:hypothetical protein